MGSGRTETIELNADEVEAMFGPDPMMIQDDEDQINMMLFVKDTIYPKMHVTRWPKYVKKCQDTTF